jgi:oxygen-independent coproporphyrinogen-3 oxidase
MAYGELGLNRLSIGFQSLDDGQLRRLGRIHTAEEALQSFSFGRDAGFANIGVDLMYAVAEQSRGDWRRTIRRVTALRPEHVSAYALTFEDGTPMHAEAEAGRVTLPPEETVVAMAESAVELLGRAGYEHYEVSNFALPGRRSQHNQLYWRGEDCIGLGAGAHGYLSGCRCGNVRDPLEYIARVSAGGEPVAFREELPPEKALGEALMLGLRMREGVDLGELQRRFGIDPAERYRRELAELEELGLVGLSDGRLRVRRAGVHLLDEVALRLV